MLLPWKLPVGCNRQNRVYCSIDIIANNFISPVRIDYRPSLKCFSGGKLQLLVIFSESAKGLCFISIFSLVTDINPALVKVWFLIFDYPIRVIVISLAIAFYSYGCAIKKERGFLTVEPCLEYYFAWEVTVDVCLRVKPTNACPYLENLFIMSRNVLFTRLVIPTPGVFGCRQVRKK